MQTSERLYTPTMHVLFFILGESTKNRFSRYPRAYARGTWELKPEIQL
jgi:hypothetical protein